MLGAEIQHLLGFRHAADQRAGQNAPFADQGTGVHRRLHRVQQAHQNVLAVVGERVQVGVEVVAHRHGVEDEIQLAGHRRHLLRVGGHHHMVGALFLRLAHLAFRAGEQGHFGAQRLGEFDAHMAEAAHAHNAHFIAGFDAVMAQR